MKALLSPANWMIFLLIFWLCIRNAKWKKLIGKSLILLFIVFTNPWFFRFASISWQPGKTTLNGKYIVAVLPGGISSYDKNNEGYFNGASDRFIQSANLFHEGKVKYIIVTGGNGFINRKNPAEADFLVEELKRNGIPASGIIVENKSRNTNQNALFTKAIYDSLHLSGKLVLVTSAMHMRRCKKEFEKAGLETISYPCNYEAIDSREAWYGYLWPDTSLPSKWERLIKEWVGYLAATLTSTV